MGLNIPSRSQLLAHYNKAQWTGKCVIFIETLISVLLISFYSFSGVNDHILELLIVVGSSVLPTLLSLAYYFAKKRKEVKDLKPTTKYGHLDKTAILDVCNTACNRMGISPNEVRFYVTPDKHVNASALTLGLGFLFKNLRVVMLNRSTLHALKKYELQSVVAHELAHIYRYPLVYQQALLLRLFNGAVFGLLLFSLLSNVLFAIIILGCYNGFLASYFGRFSITIEYLCDDCGAEVAGIEPALRAEFLIAKHSEVLSDAYFYLLKARRDGHALGAKDLASLLEDSLSYGCVSSDELNTTLKKNITKHQEKRNKNFFEYFKAQVFSDTLDAEEELEEEYLKLKKLKNTKILELPPHDADLDLSWFKRLVEKIRENPSLAAFRTPTDLSEEESTHPGPRKRILYLWQTFMENGLSI